ncbi:MAG TPA: regulatory protein RecX [Jiangellaceae bacterium]
MPTVGGRRRRRPADARDDGPVGALRDGSASDEPDADPESVARSIALRKLAAAPQTRAQLADAMARRGVPAEVRDRVLDRFDDVGLIDDAMFARMWVESRHTGRGLAKKALAHELRRRGVDSAVVDEAVAQLAPEQEETTARALVARRLPSTRGLDAATRTRRLAGMLARKGYPAGLSFRVVREALEREGVDEAELPAEDTW